MTPRDGRTLTSAFATAAVCCCGLASQSCAHPAGAHAKTARTATTRLMAGHETVGGGTLQSPAVGPPPSYGIGGPHMVLVKNWHFGADGTVRNQSEMNAEFRYHDQFNVYCNGGGNYGAYTVAPDAADAITSGAGPQPVEGVNCPPVRRFLPDSLRTFIVPLNGATTCDPDLHNAGVGSFVAKWTLPAAGSALGRDIVWETRVRYVTPPYFWFSVWTAGDKWKWDGGAQGAEIDLIESFGYDNHNPNGPDWTNYDGHFWHSNTVATPLKDTMSYSPGWNEDMALVGYPPGTYDATQYHTWTLYYKHDDTYTIYVDGKKAQSGSDYHWTFGDHAGQPPINMTFLFDGGWGHTQVKSVDHPLPASAFVGKYYEWNYSRVYLSAPVSGSRAAYDGPHTLPGTVQAEDYDTGGFGVAYNQTGPGDAANDPLGSGGQTGYRPDNNGDVHPITAPSGSGYALGWSSPGTWYKYTVRVSGTGRYTAAFRIASGRPGGTFHLEDETGRDLTGPLTVPDTGGWNTWRVVTSSAFPLKAGPHTLRLVEDTAAPGNPWVCDFDWFSLASASK